MDRLWTQADLQACKHGAAICGCHECGHSRFCVHGKRKRFCTLCGGSGLCEHNRLRFQCKQCGGVTELGSLGVRDSYLNRKLRIAEESGGGFELGTHKRCRPLCYGTSPSLPSGHFCLFIVLSFIHPDCSSFSLRDRDTAPKAHTMNFHWVGLVIRSLRYTATAPLGTTGFRHLNGHSNLLNSM